jgi:uncharacterized phage infection (PIP) family protein YhgE
LEELNKVLVADTLFLVARTTRLFPARGFYAIASFNYIHLLQLCNMADSLLELLAPHLETPPSSDATTSQYLSRLSTLSLQNLQTTEPQSLAQSAHSTLLSLQALSNRSHRSFITSADNLSTLRDSIPKLTREAQQLRDAVPKLDEAAVGFSTKYSKITDNAALERRKKAMQLTRNVDRLSDILELPSLLSTAVSAASANSGAGAASTTYSSALDLHAHIKRLQTLYPESPLIQDVAAQAEDAMKEMTTNLIAGLRAQNLRLAAGMRTVGWSRQTWRLCRLKEPQGQEKERWAPSF